MFRKMLTMVRAFGAFSILFLLLSAIPVAAQDEQESSDESIADGSIRGAVYQDGDGDGICPEEGDGPLAGVPIRFVSADGTEVLYLQSGGNGTYGLVAAGLGTWQVSAEPSADQGIVTSAQAQSVFLSNEQQLVLGVNFCVSKVAFPAGAPVILPQSGAPATSQTATGAALVALAGLCFLVAGLHLRRREQLNG